MAEYANAEGYEPEYGPNAPVYDPAIYGRRSSEPEQYYWPEYKSKTIIYAPITRQAPSRQIERKYEPPQRPNLIVLPTRQNKAVPRSGGDAESCVLQAIRLMERAAELIKASGRNDRVKPHLGNAVDTLQNLLIEADAGCMLWTEQILKR